MKVEGTKASKGFPAPLALQVKCGLDGRLVTTVLLKRRPGTDSRQLESSVTQGLGQIRAGAGHFAGKVDRLVDLNVKHSKLGPRVCMATADKAEKRGV